MAILRRSHHCKQTKSLGFNNREAKACAMQARIDKKGHAADGIKFNPLAVRDSIEVQRPPSAGGRRLLSTRLLTECRTFVADERGRSAAAAGSHDDLVMAIAIAHAVRAETIASSGRASGARAAYRPGAAA